MISVGCSLAAYGELHFEMFGFLCQCAAVAFEASRLVMIQILLHGLKVCLLSMSISKGLTDGQMDPIVSLHYYAPVCAGINLLILPFTEGLEPFYALHRVGLLVLFTNAGMAFALNVSFLCLVIVAKLMIRSLPFSSFPSDLVLSLPSLVLPRIS
jgi:hypothetical protein